MAISNNQRGSVFAEINITPLTDIFLVLLIIFMVATAITIESAAHVDLPKVEAPTTEQKPKGVLVTYTAEHAIFVNQHPVAPADLPSVLHDALDKSPEKLIVFQGDPAVILADMVHILDIAKTAGAQQIAVSVAETAAPGEPDNSGVPSGGLPGGDAQP